MSEEEKKAVEKFNNLYIKEFNGEPITTDDRLSYIECALITNLIEKLEQELNNLKEIEQTHKTDNGLLRQELDMQIEHNKELEATLKQTQDSWFEDTQKIEQEKEKNKELSAKLTEKICKGVEEDILEEYRQQIRELKEKNKELLNSKIGVDLSYDDYISKDKIKNAGKLVKNKIDGTIGIVLREWETGQVQVLEKIQPKVINTHDSWKTLEILEEE